MRRLSMLGLIVSLLVPTASLAGPRTGALVEAVKTGSVTAVRALLREKADVNAPEPDGSTALHWAADRGDAQIVESLLRAGANAKAVNRFGVRPLTLAAASGNAATVGLLLRAGADANTASAGGETALMTAARAGRADVVRVLLEHGAKVNAKEDTRGQTALMWAAAEGHADVIRVLVQHGADIRAVSHGPSSDPHITDGESAPNASGGKRVAPRMDAFTPLLFAVHAGQIDATRALLDLGGTIEDETPHGMSALVLAIANRHYELAAVLVERGANPNAAKAGFTALHQLVRTRTLNIGLFPHPVPTGAISGVDLAKVLIAHGARVDARLAKTFTDGYRYTPALGTTPLLLAAKGGDIDMMRLLVAHGADPSARNVNGATALMLACGLEMFNANEDSGTNAEALLTARFAIELGNDVNAVNNVGDGPLHGAVWRGSPELINLLVEHGARLDLKNSAGLTVLQFANGECTVVSSDRIPRGSLCYTKDFMVWRRPQVIPLLRELMVARGLKPEMMDEEALFAAGAQVQQPQ